MGRRIKKLKQKEMVTKIKLIDRKARSMAKDLYSKGFTALDVYKLLIEDMKIPEEVAELIATEVGEEVGANMEHTEPPYVDKKVAHLAIGVTIAVFIVAFIVLLTLYPPW